LKAGMITEMFIATTRSYWFKPMADTIQIAARGLRHQRPYAQIEITLA